MFFLQLLSNSSQKWEAECARLESAWRSFLLHFLSAVALGLSSIAILNYLVNPEGLYATHLLPQIRWAFRVQKAAMLKSAQPSPQALIMGSSRVMNFAPAEVQRLTGLHAFNIGVDSAKAEDFYVLLRDAVEVAHLTPKLLIIGCDVEAFHTHESRDYYLQYSVLATLLWHAQSEYWRWRSLSKLWSYGETKLSAVSLYQYVRRERTAPFHVEADGHLRYDKWEQERATGQLDLRHEIQSNAESFSASYDDYTGLAKERLEYFDSTLRYAHDHGIETVVFLTPIHPALQEGLSKHGYLARKQEVTAALQRMCTNWNVPFYDFSSPASFGGTPAHFYDGVHYDDTLAPLISPLILPVRAHALQ